MAARGRDALTRRVNREAVDTQVVFKGATSAAGGRQTPAFPATYTFGRSIVVASFAERDAFPRRLARREQVIAPQDFFDYFFCPI
jgi:hypothetical protein